MKQELITKLGEYLGKDLSQDQRAKMILDSTLVWVRNYTGRIFGGIETIIENKTPVRGEAVYLKYLDVKEIISVKADGSEIKDYVFNKETSRLDPNIFCLDLEIKYRAGVEEIPQDLLVAIFQVCAKGINKRDDDVSSESIGNYSVSFGNQSEDTDLASARSVFNYYRKPKL